MDKSLGILLGNVSRYIENPTDDKLPGIGDPAVGLYQDHGPVPSSFGCVLRYPDKTVVAFAGTISDPFTTGVRDWLANFVALLAPAMGLPGLIHVGFADQLRLVRDDILADLAGGFTAPLYVTGHSQGGAVAALAAKLLEQAGIEVAATYTYAAPLPGDGTFASSVRTPVFRLEFGDDIVPHVAMHGIPLPVQLALKASPELKGVFSNICTTLGYVAVGPLTYGAPGKSLRIDMSAAEENKLTVERLVRLAPAGQNMFMHHNLDYYIGMLS